MSHNYKAPVAYAVFLTGLDTQPREDVTLTEGALLPAPMIQIPIEPTALVDSQTDNMSGLDELV